jgi:hypothetical protein
MRKSTTIFFFSLLAIGCKTKAVKLEEDGKGIDSLIHHSELVLEKSRKIQDFTDSTSTIEIKKMRERLGKISCELEEFKKSGEIRPVKMLLKQDRVLVDTIFFEREMSFEEVERLYFEMKAQKDSGKNSDDSSENQNNQNQNKQLKNEKLPQRPFQ